MENSGVSTVTYIKCARKSVTGECIKWSSWINEKSPDQVLYWHLDLDGFEFGKGG